MTSGSFRYYYRDGVDKVNNNTSDNRSLNENTKTKLNTIAALISKDLIDSYINHDGLFQ